MFSISIQDEFRLRTMIFSLNKEIQAPSILSIITYFSRQPLVNSTPYYPFITYSLAKIRKKTQFTFPSSETIQESSSNEPSFDVHRIPSKTFLLLQKKKRKNLATNARLPLLYPRNLSILVKSPPKVST